MSENKDVRQDEVLAVEEEDAQVTEAVAEVAENAEAEQETVSLDLTDEEEDAVAEAPEGEATPEAEASEAPEDTAKDAAEETAEDAGAAEADEAPKAKKAGKPKAEKASKKAEPETKMDAAGEAGMTRAQVLRDARKRDDERIANRQAREKFLAGWAALDNARRKKRIVMGTVSSVETREMNGQEEVFLAVIVEGGFKVTVPFVEFYQRDPIDGKTMEGLEGKALARERLRRCLAMAEKVYEAEVPLVILDMLITERGKGGDFDYAIVGSRRRALDIIELQNYVGTKTEGPIIKEGDWVEATITSVSMYAVAVVVGGVDTRIPMRALTFRYLNDLRTVYAVGQKIAVEVTAIKTLQDGHHVIECNAKTPMLEETKRRQKLVPVGSTTLGIITAVRPDVKNANRFHIHAYLKMYDMPAVIRNFPATLLGRAPISGDEVRLVVRGYSDKGYVVADCRGFNGAPGLLNN